MKAVSRTDIGKVRKNNEDSVLLTNNLFAVADGMGGHNGGKEASEHAIKLMRTLLVNKKANKEDMITAIEAANRRLFEKQEEDETLKGMGTTLSALWSDDDFMVVGHVGDSRIYLYRDGVLTQITQDHSLVAELIRNGFITPQEAENHPYRNVITRAIGTHKNIMVDAFRIPVQANDKWLICSDGLHGMVPLDVIEKCLCLPSMNETADELMNAALENGGRDNVSLVLIWQGEALE